MGSKGAIDLVKVFHRCIKSQDRDGLAALMTEDHELIDGSEELHTGKDTMITGWKQFFETYPDYQNQIDHIEARGDLVLVVGRSTCSDASHDGPALWTARVAEGRTKAWRVSFDTPENQNQLKLSISSNTTAGNR